MAEVRLIPVETDGEVYWPSGRDGSPDSWADAWEAGITEEEARAADGWISGKPPPGYPDDVAMGRCLDKLRHKLRAAFGAIA